MQVRIYVWALLLVGVLSMIPLPVGAEGSETALVNVVVTYDPDGDGEREGVGPGITVALFNDGEVKQVGKTGPVSSILFAVEAGDVYGIEAYVPPTRIFFEWVCRGSFFIDEDRLVELACFEQFFLRLPFTTVAVPVE